MTEQGGRPPWTPARLRRSIDRHPAFHGQRPEQVEDGAGYGGGLMAVNQGDILLRQRCCMQVDVAANLFHRPAGRG